MPVLRYVSLLERDVDSYLTGVTDLDVRVAESGGHVLYATSRSGEAISAFAVSTDGAVTLTDHQTLATDADRIDFISIGEASYVVTLAPQEDSTRLYVLNLDGQMTGNALTLNGESVAMQSLVQMQVGQDSYLYCSDADSGTLDVFRVGPDGSLATVETDAGSASVAGIARADIGAAQYLVMTDADGQHVLSFRVGADGTLTESGSCGADQGLGVAGINTMEHVSLADGHYVVVAARDSSSISVLRMEVDGTLSPVDHIIDDLNTRFQHVTSLETVVLNDRAFVIAGGSDDGVSVFELLPGGRLLIHDTMPDSFTTTLANVSAIGAMAVDGQIQVFVGSGIETGVTQFALDPGPTGTTRIGNAGANSLVGTVTGEVLAGQAGNDTISGGAGDDVLMDGAGQDTLIGGTGNDIFVLDADGTYDEIRDFNPAEDRIDLTAWPMLRNLGQITFTTTGNGAILEFGSEQLRVYSHDGLPLAQHQLLNNNLISLTRVLAATPEPAVDPNQIAFLGDGQSNEIMANDLDNILGGGLGNDTLTGGAGNDLFIYSGGADVIEDFSGDLIQIERSQYSGSVDALLASATVVSGNLVFDFGGGYSLTLTGVTSTAGLEGRVRIGAADPGHDVSGDGTSDILLRSATGALGFYDMAGGTPSWSGLGTVATSWTVATTGDFNGDGTDDILLRNSSGATGYYDMDGGTPSWVGLGTVATSWTAIGSDDFNGDGIDDILWRSTTGAAGYYDMDGGTPSWVGLGSVPTSWDIVGTGDFNGDGTDDILWRNTSGALGMYDMDGGTVAWVGLGSVATNWSVVATGDFNGDGTDDILWRNSSGVTGFYDMDGGTPSWVGLGTVALSWDIVGTGDFNGDGTDDILWRNTSGALGMYDMDNGNPTWIGLGALDLQWDVTGQFVDEFIF